MKSKKREVVYGVEAISEVIEVPDVRRVYYMLEAGQIEGASKVGRIWRLSIPAWRRAVHGELA